MAPTNGKHEKANEWTLRPRRLKLYFAQVISGKKFGVAIGALNKMDDDALTKLFSSYVAYLQFTPCKSQVFINSPAHSGFSYHSEGRISIRGNYAFKAAHEGHGVAFIRTGDQGTAFCSGSWSTPRPLSSGHSLNGFRGYLY